MKGGFDTLFARSLPPIGLEIGTNNLRVVKLKQSPKLTLTTVAKIKAPVGAVVEGEIVDVDAVSSSLGELAKNCGLKGKGVVVGISNQKIVIRLIELPFMEQEELKNSIRFQVQEFIPISIDETVLDFQMMREFRDEHDDRFMEVLLVAAQKDMIINTVEAVQKAGLKPEAIDVSSFALIRSLLSNAKPVLTEDGEESNAVALVNIGSGVTDIALAEEGVPRFVRVTPLAGNKFTSAVSEALGVSFAEAEAIKREVGLPDEVQKASETSLAPKTKTAQEALEKEGRKFATEIRRSFDYYLAQTRHAKKIDRLILSGGGANLKNLASFLEKEFETGIEIARPLKDLTIAKGLSQDKIQHDEPSLAVAVGLALRCVA